MPLIDFLRALSPIRAVSYAIQTPATTAPLDATAGKRGVLASLHSQGHQHILLSLNRNNHKGLSPASNGASCGGEKKQEGEKSTWENAWEMKRMLKVTEELIKKDEIARGESAHKQREMVKKEQVQRKKQDKLEALRTQQEAFRNVKKQREIEQDAARADIREEYRRAMTTKKEAEAKQRAARIREREEKRRVLLEDHRRKQDEEDVIKARERAAEQARLAKRQAELAVAEKEKMEKVHRLRLSLEAQKVKRRASLYSPAGVAKGKGGGRQEG